MFTQELNLMLKGFYPVALENRQAEFILRRERGGGVLLRIGAEMRVQSLSDVGGDI